jgi:hypothetical protein
MMARKPDRTVRRATYYAALIDAAPTATAALDAAWDWLTASLVALQQRDPMAADRARRSMADQLAEFARQADKR